MPAPASEPSQPQEPAAGLPSNPGKAQSFFSFARREGLALDGALSYWIMGLREDPGNATMLKEFLDFAWRHQTNPQLRSTKESERDLRSDQNPANPWGRAILAAAVAPTDAKAAAAACDVALRFRLEQSAIVLAERAISVLALGRTAKSDARVVYEKVIQVLRGLKSFELAERGAIAVSALFPNDAELQELKRNVSAQRYSYSQGHDQPITEGTFHRNVRDPDLQRKLEQEGRLGGEISDIDQRVDAARTRLTANPSESGAVVGLAEILLRRNREGDESEALGLLETKAKELSSSILRTKAGELLVRIKEREARQLEAAGPEHQAEVQQKRREILLIKKDEYQLRVREEPSNSKNRYELGKVLLELGHLKESVTEFQAARQSSEQAPQSCKGLIRAYFGLGLYLEVVQSYNDLLQTQKLGQPEAQDLGKRLLDSLITRAEDNSDKAHASAALAAVELASNMLHRKFEEGPLLSARRRLDEIVGRLAAA